MISPGLPRPVNKDGCVTEGFGSTIGGNTLNIEFGQYLVDHLNQQNFYLWRKRKRKREQKREREREGISPESTSSKIIAFT